MQNPCSLNSLVDGVENLKVRLNVCQSIGVEKVFLAKKLSTLLGIAKMHKVKMENA